MIDRRTFLERSAAAVAAALTLPPEPPADPIDNAGPREDHLDLRPFSQRVVIHYPEDATSPAPVWFEECGTNLDVAKTLLARAAANEAMNGTGRQYLRFQINVLNGERDAERQHRHWRAAVLDQHGNIEWIPR